MSNDYFDDFDDTICVQCHSALQCYPVENTPDWFGYCSATCMDNHINRLYRQLAELEAKLQRKT